MGINTSVLSAANVWPPLLSGLVAARYSPSAPVILGAVICFGSWLLFLRTVKPSDIGEHAPPASVTH
jgi:hypothetical protein